MEAPLLRKKKLDFFQQNALLGKVTSIKFTNPKSDCILLYFLFLKAPDIQGIKNKKT